MASQEDQVPRDRRADERWKSLDRERRAALVRGQEPESHQEALIALGYGRRMRQRTGLFALVGALGAFVVYLAIALLVEGAVTSQTLILAGGVGVGAGVGLEIAGRWRAGRLEKHAEAVLSR